MAKLLIPAFYLPSFVYVLGLLPTGRAQADYTAQVLKNKARGFFFPRRRGKSAPVGVRTPPLRVPLAVSRPTELTTFGLCLQPIPVIFVSYCK